MRERGSSAVHELRCGITLASAASSLPSAASSLPLPQGVVPASVFSAVVELFVPSAQLPAAKEEAATLPKLALTKLDTQWLQVGSECSVTHHSRVPSGSLCILSQ